MCRPYPTKAFLMGRAPGCTDSGSLLRGPRIPHPAGVAMPNTNGHGPKWAILYARVSTDEQARSGYSLAQQLEALRDHAARESYEVLEEVQDAG